MSQKERNEWIERAKQRVLNNAEITDQSIKEIMFLFDEAAWTLETEINSMFQKYATENGLTNAEASKLLTEIYKDVYRFRNSVLITSGFILLIVIMGLIGYVNDETQRRSKEIAIRKVNGAEASNILRLLVCDILYVSIPSILLGIVIAYFIGKAWLEQFAEQVDLNPLLFLATALVVAIIIVACVVLKAWHIANENPVNSIKSE